MFASSIQIVTLFAFIAHAVLGCCWHHSHATQDCTAQAAAESQPSACSAPATENGCGHHHAASAPAVAVSNVEQHVKQSCCSSSHQPADHCTASRCSYISAKLLTLDLSDAASLEGFVSSCGVQRQLPAVHANRHCGHWTFFSSPQSSGEHCAHLQTWQI